MTVVGSVLLYLLLFFIACLWVRFVMGWVMIFAPRWTPSGVVLVVLEVVYSITDPPIKALRSFVPTLRLGNFALDLSFLLVMVIAYLLLNLVSALFGVWI